MAVVAAFAVCLVAAAAAFGGEPPSTVGAGAAHGLVHARGDAGRGGHGGGGSPLLVFHGGQIMSSADVTPIYWGTSWSVGNSTIAGLTQFYGGIGNSSYLGTNTEYGGSNGQVGTGVSLGTAIIDNSAAPSRPPQTSDIAAEVGRMIPTPVANGYYPVYTDLPRGHAGYCAWHSWATINGVLTQFAFFFKLDGDPGCDPKDTQTGHSEGLAALANVSGHELSEALTDPRGDAWFDSSGAENADKCAWTFSGTPENLKNNTSWKIQGNFSNAAYAAHSGYDGAGCIDGN
jgi:hypothetical protein